MTNDVYIGDPEGKQGFNQKFGKFIELTSKNLPILQEAAFLGIEQKDLADQVIYLTMHMIWEDFGEIMVLMSNGYTTGAMKILRGMFERNITISYFQQNPAEVKRFMDYYWISNRKEANWVNKYFPGTLPQQTIDEIEKHYQKVKPQFEIPGPRGRKQVSHTWKMDMVQMASKILDTNDAKLFVYAAYYVPMQETHVTVAAMLRRLKHNPDGTLQYSHETKNNEDDHTLIVAHNLLLRSFKAFYDHFKPTTMEKPLEQCWDDFQAIWKKGGGKAANTNP